MEKEIVTIYQHEKEVVALNEQEHKLVTTIQQKILKVYVSALSGEKYVEEAAAVYLGLTNSQYTIIDGKKCYEISDKILEKLAKEGILIQYITLNINHKKTVEPSDNLNDTNYDNYEKYDLYVDINTIAKLGFKYLNEKNINDGLYGPLTQEEFSIINNSFDVEMSNYDQSKNRNR